MPDASEVQNSDNIKMLNSFFLALIISCCFVLVLPSTTYTVSTVLFCYFFISICIGGLVLTWYYLTSEENNFQKTLITNCQATSAALIIVTLIYSFFMISSFKKKIQSGNVTDYYYKFTLINVWLLTLECAMLYMLHVQISKAIEGDNNMITTCYVYTLAIICFCVLSFFVSWSNVIGLKNFSADG